MGAVCDIFGPRQTIVESAFGRHSGHISEESMMYTRFFGLAVLTVFASAAAVDTACAQGLPWSRQGEYLYRERERYQQYYPTPSATEPAAVVPFANPDTNRSFYPSTDEQVRIHIVVPADAKITFDGKMTRQNGTQRDFQSPPLETGFRYSYTIQATLDGEREKEVTQKRVVPVHPGDDVNLTITRDSVSVNRGQ